MSNQPYETLLTRGEAAQRLNVSISTFRRLENQGKIPRVQISGCGVRYRPTSIQAYIEGREIFIKPKY